MFGRERRDRILTKLALEAGYFDRSHFSREILAATGAPPGLCFRTGAYR